MSWDSNDRELITPRDNIMGSYEGIRIMTLQSLAEGP